MSAHTPAFDAPLGFQPCTAAAPSEPRSPDPRRLRVFEVFGDALVSFHRSWVRLLLAEVLAVAVSVAATLLLDLVCGLFAQGVAQVGALAPLGLAVILFGQVLGAVVTTLLTVGQTRMFLEAARGRKPALSLLFSGRDRLWPMLVVSLAVPVLVLLGAVLLVVPGVIAALAMLLTHFVVVDRGGSGIAAMRESYRLTRGFRIRLLALCAIGALLLVLGFLAARVGVLVAVPIVGLTFAHAYLRLTGEAS